MPIVRIDIWKGRPREQKDTLIRNVTDAVVKSVGCPEQAVEVLLYEIDKSDWATGGICHSEQVPDKGPSLSKT